MINKMPCGLWNSGTRYIKNVAQVSRWGKGQNYLLARCRSAAPPGTVKQPGAVRYALHLVLYASTIQRWPDSSYGSASTETG